MSGPERRQTVKKFDGAASVIRTRDLTLTKGALYRWSYGSIAIDGPDLHDIAPRLQACFSDTLQACVHGCKPRAITCAAFG